MRTLSALGPLTMVCFVAFSLWTSAVDRGARAYQYTGEADYQTYCSSCHGAAGKGDGSMAKALPKRPPDLTRLAKRSNDVFPDEKVFNAIDGRTPGRSHAGDDMPIWGDVFAKSSGSLGPEAAAARIQALVEYVRTLQEKP